MSKYQIKKELGKNFAVRVVIREEVAKEIIGEAEGSTKSWPCTMNMLRHKLAGTDGGGVDPWWQLVE